MKEMMSGGLDVIPEDDIKRELVSNVSMTELAGGNWRLSADLSPEAVKAFASIGFLNVIRESAELILKEHDNFPS